MKLRFNIPLNTKYVMPETLFPANLLASTQKQCHMVTGNMHEKNSVKFGCVVPEVDRHTGKGVDLTGLLGGHKKDWGSGGRKSPSRVQVESPGRGSEGPPAGSRGGAQVGGLSPPEAEAFL